MATEHTGTKGNSGALRWRFFVFRAAWQLLVFRVAGDLLVFFTAATCQNFPIRPFIFPRCITGEVAPVFSGDVMLGFDSGMVLWLGGLRSRVFVTLSVLAILAPWLTIHMNVVLVVIVILGEVRRRRGGGGGYRGTVLAHLINKENLGHVVNNEDFCPVWDWLGLCTTEVDIHDEDGERCGGCDHGHSGNVVLPWLPDGNKNRQRSLLLEQVTSLTFVLFVFCCLWKQPE